MLTHPLCHGDARRGEDVEHEERPEVRHVHIRERRGIDALQGTPRTRLEKSLFLNGRIFIFDWRIIEESSDSIEESSFIYYKTDPLPTCCASFSCWRPARNLSETSAEFHQIHLEQYKDLARPRSTQQKAQAADPLIVPSGIPVLGSIVP